MIHRARNRSRVGIAHYMLGLLVLLMAGASTSAHELRPAYLELRETRSGELRVLWKTPMRGDRRLALIPELSGPTELLTPVRTRSADAAAVQTWTWRVSQPIRGQSLRIAGLRDTLTDALVRLELADGSSWVKRLTAVEPEAAIPLRPSGLQVAGEYLKLGVEHILTGIDHLLFVLALLLLSSGSWALFKTVTAFTFAHSLTLSAATLGWVAVPSAPVEAVIAASIVLVATEIVHRRRGRVGLAARSPWIVAFSFGLLHGFGFAGALSQVGLPQVHIPLALLCFNLGVEAGQLMFIAASLALLALGRRLRVAPPSWMELVPAYAIGSVAMFWVMQRVASF